MICLGICVDFTVMVDFLWPLTSRVVFGDMGLFSQSGFEERLEEFFKGKHCLSLFMPCELIDTRLFREKFI